MGKTSSTYDVLKAILKDVSNVQNIIEDSTKLEKNIEKIDFDDAQQVERIIEATKLILDNLKTEAIKIHSYFESNCMNWNVTLTTSNAEGTQVNNNNKCDTSENDDGFDSSHKIEDSTVNDNTDSLAEDRQDNGEISETSNGAKNDIEGSTEEPKRFLKCVDINKLMNPDILPHLTSPKPLPAENNCDDNDVLIISDSEDESHQKSIRNEVINNRTISRSHNVRSKVSQANRRKVSYEAASSATVVVKRNLRRTKTQKKYKEDSDSDLKSSSSSDSDSDCNTLRKKITKSSKYVVKNTKAIEDYVKDDKFFYKAYVPLPRVPCEKLKEHYLNEKEIDEVNRLINLKTLKKKRPRKNSGSSSSSSTESRKLQKKGKRQRKSSKNSSESDICEPVENDEVTSSLLEDPTEVQLNGNTNEAESEELLNSIINRISSDSDKDEKTADDDEKESDSKNEDKKNDKDKDSSDTENENAKDNSSNTKKAEKDGSSSDKHSDEDKNKDSADDASTKDKSSRNWRKNKLLTGKLSDTDSEEEKNKCKKNYEKEKSDGKSSPSKEIILQPIVKIKRLRKKSKKVITSDSESGGKESSSDDDIDNKSSSSSSEEEQKKTKTKRSRIKRVKDSSDEDMDKSTRRTIRKVIGHESLAESTKRAEKEEQERKQRISDRQKKYNQIFDCDKPADATIDKLVLDFNEETKEELLSVDKKLVKVLKPHQGKGVQFMWDACYESVHRAKSTDGSGCILAHCMGLGKTLQVIALTHTLLMNEDTKVSRVLVVCPLNTVLNWVSEYKKWLGDNDVDEIDVFELVSCKQNHREFVVEDWFKNGGVLIIGYDMFRNLTNPNNKRLKKKSRESFNMGLLNPGPDLVICDEGHLLKNEKTNLSIAMNRIRTARRIVLTGTPMQNNLKEYYCMVQFVKPNLLGTYKEYINRFVNPITNGQYTDSTEHDINIMRKRSHVLHKLLDGVVQRKDYGVLMPFLPPKYEYVLFLSLTETQIKLYQHYKDNFSQRPVDNKVKSSFLFTDFQEFQRICTHPRVLLNKSIEERNKYTSDEEDESEGSIKDFIDDNESEAKSTSSSSSNSDSEVSVKSKKRKPQQRLTRTAAAASGIDIDQVIQENKEVNCDEWWRQYCDGDDLDDIGLSTKLYLLFQILQECELIGDKLLVFSQSLYSLNIIEYFLSKIDDATQHGDDSKVCGFSGSWTLGLDYFRLDGSSSCDNRAAWCRNFNSLDNPRARLFLISTRAGGLGINLVGANRVIIFDVSWNPSHDTQSIYRVFRFGQTKPCYIYRFVIWGTMELKIYERQVTKQAISKRVIDEQQIDRHYNQNDLAELYNFDPVPSEQDTPLVPKDVLLAELLQKHKDRIYKYHEHQSLLENKEDEELNEAERKAAWEEFEIEKTRVNTSSNMGWIKNLPLQSVHIALTNIIQNDNPGWTKEQVRQMVPLIIQQLRQQVDVGETTLFDRITNEVRQLHQVQKAKYEDYLRQQQEQQQMRILNHYRNQLLTQRGIGFPTNPNEVVELND